MDLNTTKRVPFKPVACNANETNTSNVVIDNMKKGATTAKTQPSIQIASTPQAGPLAGAKQLYAPQNIMPTAPQVAQHHAPQLGGFSNNGGDRLHSAYQQPFVPAPLSYPANSATAVTSADELAKLMGQTLRISKPEDTYQHDEEDDEKLNVSTEKVDWEKERKEMDKLFEKQTEEQLEGLADFVKPIGLKDTTNPFPHQEDGIRWLVQQEKNPKPNPFVRERTLKSGEKALYCRLSRGRLRSPHEPSKGSILADDMGMGKTLQTISLILSNPPEGYEYGKTDGDEIEAPICTVIVCPKTVISNWIQQIGDFVKPGTLKIKAYDGTPKQRSKIIESVLDNEVDILLSSYETISAELGKKRTDSKGNELESIHGAGFHRIILDEAHVIRNHKNKVFKAITSVSDNSKYRLALTGTVFVNKPEDIHSLLVFLGLKPLAEADLFKKHITDPIKDRKRAGLTRLRAALSYVAMRRTKTIISNSIPPKTINVHRVEFPDGEHKEIHDILFLAAQRAFDASINGRGREYTEGEVGVGQVANQAMFGLLTRVRQSCASGSLVSSKSVDVAKQAMDFTTDENGQQRELTSKEGNHMLELLQSTKEDNDERLNVAGHSPKVAALLKLIEEMKPDEKGVIFSQWTSFLDIIEKALEGAGFDFVRIDGSCSTEARTDSIVRFKNDDGVRFILCSLKAAGVGINLIRGNVCFMMDPWWNDAIEMQAIDRVHRLSQTRAVRVYRLVMKGTIEERMLDVQKAKSTLGKGTMAKLSKAEEKIAKMTGIKDLFQIKAEGSEDDFIDWE